LEVVYEECLNSVYKMLALRKKSYGGTKEGVIFYLLSVAVQKNRPVPPTPTVITPPQAIMDKQ